MGYRQQITEDYFSSAVWRHHSDDDQALRRRLKALDRRFCRFLPKDKEAPILDLACGTGEFVLLLQKKGYKNVKGVDLCERGLEKAESIGARNVFKADIRQYLRTFDGEFGFITALDILEHLRKDEIIQILSDIHRALIPGGQLLATVPNAHSPLVSQIRYGDFSHEVGFSTNSWYQLAMLTDFCPPAFRECGPIPYGAVSLTRWGLWKLLRALIIFYNLVELGAAKTEVYTQNMIVVMKKPDVEHG